MKLTKNTRLGKKPYKANNGYAAYDPTTFDPTKQIALNEQEFGVTPSSVQTPNTGVAPQGGQSALRLEGAKTTPDLSGQKIDFSKSSSGASAMSPKSFDYSGLATTGMAMGVGAIDKQQASLEAVGKAPSLSGEMGKGALKGAATVTPMALNPAMLAATGGLSALAVPAAAAIGAGVNYVTGNKKIKEFNTQMDAKKSLARQALTNRTNLSSQYNQADAVNRGYSAQGSNMSSFYGKNGGKLKFGNGGELVPNKKEMTRLPEHQEVAYQNWMKDNKYEESADYDYRGYWKEEGFKGLAKPNLSPMQKIKEVSSEVYPELDNFYKNNPNVAGMNHAPGEVSKNPYSKIPSKNLDYIIDLEKARDIMSNDVNAPKPKYRITRDQKNYFKSIKDNSSDTTDYADTPKKVQRETIASRLYVGDNMDNVAYTKKQDRYVGDLIKYANTRPNHLPDKFKRLAPFGEGDGYMQLSDESNKASEFDKRGQGTWVDDRFVAYKNGGKMRCDDGAIIRKDGGFLKSVSSDTKLAYGKTHEQGGILMSENAEIEGGGVTRDGKKLPGETVVDKGDHTLVVSDNLVNPKTGRTFAKDDLRLAKLARKYEGASTQLAKNSLKHIQAKREELHDLQQQMNGDASDMDTAQNGGKMRPVNILTKPIKTAVPSRPKPMLAQNGGKLRPINILTKPVRTSPRPATHFAKNGMKLYGDGGVNASIPFPKTPKTYSDSLKYEAIDRLNRENTKGATGGKQGVDNYGYTHPKWKILYPNVDFTDPKQVLAVDEKEMAYPNSFKGKMRNQLTDYKFHSNRNVNDLMLLADSKNTGITLDDVNSNDPAVAKKLQDAWAQHGSRLSTMGNDKTFNDNLNAARKELLATNPLTGGGRGTLAKPHPNAPAWYERSDAAANLDYSKGESKATPSNTKTASTPSKGITKSSATGDYYDQYKKNGSVNLGGKYSVRKNTDGLIEYSNDGKTYSRPDKATYDKLNSTVFKGKLGKYADSNIPPKLDLSKIDNSSQPFRVGDTNPVAGNTIGKRVSDNSPVGGTMEGYNKTPQRQTQQSSSLKGDSNNAGLRQAWDKTKEIGESALPSLSRAGKLASYAAPGLAQYYANKADIARQEGMDIPEYKKQRFEVLAKQRMEVDRTAIIKQQADYNAGITGTLADSQTAALMKANMASKAGDALVGVNQAERNANIETANRQTHLNLGIDAANKEGEYKQAYSQLEKDIDLSRRKARNVAELSANMQQVQDVDRREKWADADTLVKVAGLEDRGIKYLDKIGANPAGHYTGRKLIGRNGGKLTKLRK